MKDTLRLRSFFIYLILGIFISLLDYKNLFFLPKSFLEVVTTPIQYGLYQVSLKVTRQFEFIAKARTAAQSEGALKEQLAQILSENANLRRKLGELQAYAAQSESLNPQTFNLKPARPVGLSRYFKIDKGVLEGVVLGQAVVYKDNLLGQIVSTSPHQSDVKLITDPESKIAAFVTSDNGRARGVLSGQFGSEMLLDKILHSESIKEKDLVYSEGTESSLPRGLILGQVTKVMERENEVFKQAIIKPVFDPGDLDVVFIITQ